MWAYHVWQTLASILSRTLIFSFYLHFSLTYFIPQKIYSFFFYYCYFFDKIAWCFSSRYSFCLNGCTSEPVQIMQKKQNKSIQFCHQEEIKAVFYPCKPPRVNFRQREIVVYFFSLVVLFPQVRRLILSRTGTLIFNAGSSWISDWNKR